MYINQYKVMSVMRDVQACGKLPEDEFGNVLPIDDMIGWYELEEKLTEAELRIVKHELELMAEAQFLLGHY